ncbi:Follistatin-related protein 5, partial [Armadillidium nasatum]
YSVIGNGTQLHVRNIGYADTGAYMCQATSIGGIARDISSLVVQENPTPTGIQQENRFFVFHDWGAAVYEPDECRLHHVIQGTDVIPGTQEYVIVTDQYPVELSYVENLDQVWVLNWRSVRDEGVKTIQDLRHEFRYAYVTHTNQRGLYKLDLANMKYVKTVDLTPYNCVPQHLVFSSLHGLVIMECAEPVTGRRTGQLVLDYLTDAVLTHKIELTGRPHTTPDSSLVVTVDTKDRVKIVVQKVTEHGLEYTYDVVTTLNISDVTFFPSRYTHSYDLFAASTDKDDILFLDLQTGKVEMITGVGSAMPRSLTEWHNTNRAIISSGIFGHYMVTPAENAIFVLNGESKTVNCEIGSLVHPRIAVWVITKYF